MAKIYDFDNGLDHFLSELICLNCNKRHLSLRTFNSWLKDLECPFCSKTGYLIETGEVISNVTYDKTVKENPNMKIFRRYEQVYQKEEEN